MNEARCPSVEYKSTSVHSWSLIRRLNAILSSIQAITLVSYQQ